MDIIEFQTSPIAAEDTSTVPKVFIQPKRWMRATSLSSVGIARNEP